jgi:trigger factor
MTVTVDKEEVRSSYDALLTEYGKRIQFPGFRKGKVPRDVLIRKFGEALKGEALSKIIEDALTGIFEDESLSRYEQPLPYSSPKLENESLQLDLETDLVFSVVYDTFPQVTVGTRKDLEIEVPDVVITDEDLNRELAAIQERNAIVLDRNDTDPAAQGDVVTVNYSELNDAGEVMAGSERQDFVFTLGSGYNIYQFDDDIIGMKKGETKEIEKQFSANNKDPELAGKTKKIRVTVTALKEKKLPDLDDELAQDVDEKYQTLEDLKADIRSRLNTTLEERLRRIRDGALLDKILETTSIEVPESMIRLQMNSRWRNLSRHFNQDEGALEELLEHTGKDQDDFFEEWKPAVEKELKSQLVTETLVKELAIAVSDEEIEKEVEAAAEKSGTPLEEAKNYYNNETMRGYLKDDIKERKLFELLIAENKVKKGEKVSYLDLASNNG